MKVFAHIEYNTDEYVKVLDIDYIPHQGDVIEYRQKRGCRYVGFTGIVKRVIYTNRLNEHRGYSKPGPWRIVILFFVDDEVGENDEYFDKQTEEDKKE
jgi:hypothetical protein